MAPHFRDPQARCQVLPAGVAQRGIADALALFDQLADKTPGVGPAVLGDGVADVEQVLPRLRRERDRSHQALRFLPGLVTRVGSA